MVADVANALTIHWLKIFLSIDATIACETMMKLSTILLEANMITGYTTTGSIHQVRRIFRNGFVDIMQAGRVCFVRDEEELIKWSDSFGIYAIKIEIVPNAIQYMGSSECGASPEGITPIKWGIIYKDNIHWQNEDPSNFDINNIDKSKLESWDIYGINRDKNNTEEDAILHTLLGRSWSYKSESDYTPQEYNKIINIVKKSTGQSLVDAYKKSGLSLIDFQFGITELLSNGMIKWSDFT